MTYYDDMLSAETPKNAEASFNHLYTLLQDLRVPISTSKLAPPSTRVTCLGIQIDSVKQTLAIPNDKLADIIKKCSDALSKKKHFF